MTDFEGSEGTYGAKFNERLALEHLTQGVSGLQMVVGREAACPPAHEALAVAAVEHLSDLYGLLDTPDFVPDPSTMYAYTHNDHPVLPIVDTVAAAIGVSATTTHDERVGLMEAWSQAVSSGDGKAYPTQDAALIVAEDTFDIITADPFANIAYGEQLAALLQDERIASHLPKSLAGRFGKTMVALATKATDRIKRSASIFDLSA